MEDKEVSYSEIQQEFNDAIERVTEMFNSHPQRGMIAHQYRKRRFLINHEYCLRLIECDWKRFYETSEFANSTSYLGKVLEKAIQESPEYVHNILRREPELMDDFIELIPMVTTAKMRVEYIHYLIGELKNKAIESSEISWTNVFNAMVLSDYREFDEIGSLYVTHIKETGNASPRTKINILEKWLNTYGNRIGDTVKTSIDTAISDFKKQLANKYLSGENDYRCVKESLEEHLNELDDWVQSMTDEDIQTSYELCKDNNEELLTYDSETFTAIYQSLEPEDLYIALNGDQIQFKSDFNILMHAEHLLEEVTDDLDKTEAENFMDSLSYKLRRNGLKNQAKMILSLDYRYPYISKEYLNTVAYCSEPETVISVYGPENVFIYLIDRNLYTDEMKDLRKFCKILYNHTTEYFNELLNDS